MDLLVNKGCVYQALKSNIIKKEELLNYIIEFPNDLTSMIAYRQLCCQDLEHGDFFDRLNKSNVATYAYIHVLSGGDSHQVKVKKSDVETLMKLNDCIKSLTGYKNDKFLIVGGMNNTPITRDNYHSFVSFDRVDSLSIRDKDELRLVIDRLKLISSLKDYFEVVKPKYAEIMKKSNIEKLVGPDTISDIKLLFKPEDEIISKHLFELDEGTMAISNSSKSIKAYMMGFEVFTHNPKDAEINQRLILASISPDELVKVIQQNPVYNVESINVYDTLSNNWKDYLPFDIYPYNDENHTYVFTRSEFDWIITNKKNPWNNKELPKEVIDYIDFIQGFAIDNKFPTAKPMKENWAKPDFLESDTGSILMKAFGLAPTRFFSFFQ